MKATSPEYAHDIASFYKHFKAQFQIISVLHKRPYTDLQAINMLIE